MPPPLNAISVGDALELFGLPFTVGHCWLYKNFGDPPVPQDSIRWIKEISVSRWVGPNLELCAAICYQWPKERKSEKAV